MSRILQIRDAWKAASRLFTITPGLYCNISDLKTLLKATQYGMARTQAVEVHGEEEINAFYDKVLNPDASGILCLSYDDCRIINTIAGCVYATYGESVSSITWWERQLSELEGLKKASEEEQNAAIQRLSNDILLVEDNKSIVGEYDALKQFFREQITAWYKAVPHATLGKF